MPAKELSSSYQDLFDKQLQFGLRSLFLGHFVLQWQSIQHNYLVLNYLPHREGQARQSITSIGFVLFHHVRALWDARNNSLHKPDPAAPVGYKRLMLQTQATELYNKLDHMLHCDKFLLDTPLPDILRQSNAQIKAFLDFTTPLVLHSIKLATENNREFIPINRYFRPA